MNFVENHLMDGESVLAVGYSTSVPYNRYYSKNWRPIKNSKQLESILEKGNPTWLIYTFPVYLKTSNPDLMAFINKNFTTIKVFRGTVRGGDIYVTKTEPL